MIASVLDVDRCAFASESTPCRRAIALLDSAKRLIRCPCGASEVTP